jgi:hypothetical protein
MNVQMGHKWKHDKVDNKIIPIVYQEIVTIIYCKIIIYWMCLFKWSKIKIRSFFISNV